MTLSFLFREYCKWRKNNSSYKKKWKSKLNVKVSWKKRFWSWLTFIKKQRPICSVKKGVLKNFAKFTGKQLCQRLFLRPATLLKKSLWHRCLLDSFAKFLVTPFSQNTPGRLVLFVKKQGSLAFFRGKISRWKFYIPIAKQFWAKISKKLFVLKLLSPII